jgi:hypothetical protein
MLVCVKTQSEQYWKCLSKRLPFCQSMQRLPLKVDYIDRL